MKQKGKRLVALILALVLCMGCVVTAAGAETQEKFDFVGANMTLGNELTLNFRVNASDLEPGKTYTAQVTHNGEVTTHPLKAVNASYYSVSYAVAAKQMADTVTVVICDETGAAVSNAYSTSVREYAMKILAMSSMSKLVKTVVVDMLNYGALAQQQFKYNTADLANCLLTPEQQALATDTVLSVSEQVKGTNCMGATLTLEYKILLNLMFKGTDTTGMYAEISYTDYKGAAQTAVVESEDFGSYGSYIKIVVDQIVLSDAFCPVSVVLYNADGSVYGYGTDSVESYVARAAQADLNDAILKFARSAQIYLADREGIALNTPHVVSFVDYDGTVLSRQKVKDGEAAVPPADPVREGYVFLGWNGSWEAVTEDTVITASYVEKSAGAVFTPQVQTGEDGLITVSVGLGESAQLSGFDVRLGYDVSKVELVSHGSEFVTSGGAMLSYDAEAGQVRAMMLGSENVTADEILYASFRAKEDAVGLASFTVEPVMVLSANADGSYRAVTGIGGETKIELDHVWDEGVESDNAITYTCTICGQTRVEEISGHNWNTGELTKAATETAAGEILYTCLDDGCGETKLEAVPAGTRIYTRADLEAAVEELSWDYLLKKDKIQYDSMELDAMGKYYSGKFLVTEGAAPEYGTSHTEINSVCSDYVWKVYEEALHHNLLGVNSSLEAVTADMWYNAENQVYTSDEEDVDSTVVRWQSLAFTDLEKQYGVPDSPHFVETKEEVFEYFLNWETMLRPGDVLVDKGHALIFAGNGKVLHCNGTKYQPSDNTLNHEDSGSVNGVSPLSCTDTSWLNTRANSGRLIVFRPTEFLVTKDTDGDLGNDIVKDSDWVMPADTLSRLEYPGMEIDRTVDITPFGTASVGQELTYSVKISNLSNDSKYMAAKQVADSTYAGVKYEDLVVTETIPEGTEFVSATESGVYDEETGIITWTLDLNAGKSVTPSYTVEVTGQIGDMIVNDGGFVADIPSNSISNRIGGTKLNEFAQTALLEIAESDTAAWNYGTDLQFAESIYEAAETALDLPAVSELVEDLFDWTSTLGEIRNTRYSAGKDNVDVFMLREDADMSMIVPTYYGGYRFFTGSDAIGTTISEFRLAYLEPGDIIVNADTDAGVVTSAQVAVYAGDDTLLISNADGTYQVLSGTAAKLQLWKSFLASNDLFFALRPSQAADLKAAHTWDEGAVTKEPTCAEEGEMTFTCLDDGCGQTKTKVLPKTTDHSWSDDAQDNGNGTHTASCTVCGESKTSAHVWDDGVADEEDAATKIFTCTVCGAVKEEVGGLTVAQVKALQDLTYHKGSMAAGANSRQRPVHFADTIYSAIGIDGLVETFNSGLTAAGVLAQPFCRVDSNGSVYGQYDRDYVLRTYANGYIEVNGVIYETANMMVDHFYGGTWIVDEEGNRLSNAADDRSITELQPGDVILLGENTASFTALLWVAVYQGEIDGQDVFIFGNTYYGSYTNVPATTSYRGKLCFNAETGILEDAEFNSAISSTGTTVELVTDGEIGTFTFHDFLKRDLVCGVTWEYFYALRPCKVLGTGE